MSSRFVGLDARRGFLRLVAASAFAALFSFSSIGSVLGAPSEAELRGMLTTIDERQRNAGDYRARVFIEQKQRGKADTIYEADVYRRSRDQKFVMRFLKPKASYGQGYLRVDSNLWFYDATLGRWERRTERERIAGTNGRRSDLDESRLAADYDPEYLGEDSVGAYQAVRLKLRAKAESSQAFPLLTLWVDKKSGNLLKRQEFALSGKLLRTTYYPKWKTLFSESKKADVWYPAEIRLFDEIEKENQSLIVTKEVDLAPLPDGIFTKAWLESKSR